MGIDISGGLPPDGITINTISGSLSYIQGGGAGNSIPTVTSYSGIASGNDNTISETTYSFIGGGEIDTMLIIHQD